MTEERIEQLATTAAKWWADLLRSPALSNFDNGDQSLSGGITMLLGALHTPNPHQDVNRSKKIDKFELFLKDMFIARLRKGRRIFVLNDYYPNQILVDAAKKAGLMRRFFAKHGETMQLGFPQKCWMTISDAKGICVKNGYGASPETIMK